MLIKEGQRFFNSGNILCKSFLNIFLLALVACGNDCQNAKTAVQENVNIYLNALLQGQKGASVDGGVETIHALQIAQVKCNDPNLKIEDFIK